MSARNHPWLRALALGLVLACFALRAPAHAEERISVLTNMLTSRSDKTRLSAVLALAKLADRNAQPPLISALNDSSMRVRAVAATALGRLGCSEALPALRRLAVDDPDPEVRSAASTATMKIARLGHPTEYRAAKTGELETRSGSSSTLRPVRGDRGDRVAAASVREPGEPRAELYVLINSSSDDSPGTTDKATRKSHAEIIKRVLADRMRSEQAITTDAGDAQRWRIAAQHIDLSVTKLDAVKRGGFVEIDAQLRLAISDENGKLVSFLSGGAKVQVSKQTYDPSKLPGLRREALVNAMRGMFDKLLAHLREHPEG